MDTLSDVLTSSQIDLLSRTLQLQKSSEDTSESLEKIKDRRNANNFHKQGLCPELKLTNAFSALFTSAKAEDHILNNISQQHEVFAGVGDSKQLFEEGFYSLDSSAISVVLRGDLLRTKVWNEKATRIQSAWRGTKTRERVLIQFKQILENM